MELTLPYGKSVIPCRLPDERVAGIISCEPESAPQALDASSIVRTAMARPYSSPALRDLARGKRNIVLIASDHTRPVPSQILLPLMLEELRQGSPEAQVTILVATGCHRATTAAELREKFGETLLARERIVIHDCDDAENLVTLGTLPSGGELRINRLAAQADLLVAEGFIEPHFFAGFSGGRKSVLPGIASRTCVLHNHCSSFMDSPYARTGILADNPIHRDMLFAAREARLAYIVNVVLDARGQVIAAFAGDFEAAHQAGAAFVLNRMRCPAIPADIVITTNNGYPMDQNVYQMVKGMCTAEATCRDGGVIIAVGQCCDGAGGESFRQILLSCPSASALLAQFRATAPEETIPDQWQVHIMARILEHHSVILISDMPDEEIRRMHMIPAHSIAQALDIADRILPCPGKITVIPEGISAIIVS